jgi:hypothetical protein
VKKRDVEMVKVRVDIATWWEIGIVSKSNILEYNL